MKVVTHILTIVLLNIGAIASFACMEFSDNSIEKNLNFLGSKIHIFLNDNNIKDFIIELKGPARNYKVTKKKVNLGVWLDSERFEMQNVLGMYSIGYSSNELMAKNLYNEAIYEIAKKAAQTNFNDAFLKFFQQHHEKEKLFSLIKLDRQNPSMIIPKNAPLGLYRIILYEIVNDKMIYVCQKEFVIQRDSLLEKLYIISREYNILYTVFVIVAAILTSFFANKLMKRR
ncbi:putative transmembrane protein [Candidatus Cyrtobacter comes]|uniref:Transmembrane protein n=1 Tax=Candidatus Cyrtobacter comes TaxID=675776 RepID=A0ABU5L956_9RICK|nr:TIGR02186 family protein [Candidatus Cyrtobacter comes]MDZ5762663.1 putative transmembrane protein [Candidatus Cyrtobacter comes]